MLKRIKETFDFLPKKISSLRKKVEEKLKDVQESQFTSLHTYFALTTLESNNHYKKTEKDNKKMYAICIDQQSIWTLEWDYSYS